MKTDKTMTPKHAPVCKTCNGKKTVTVIVKGVEKQRRCPACGGAGDGKMSQK